MPDHPTAPSLDVAAFDHAWSRSWPEVTPIAHLLRSRFPVRWIRFHSLPGAQRYAASEAEHAEILHRHRSVLATLIARSGPRSARLVAVTCSWSETYRPVPRDSAVSEAMPDALHWLSVNRATDPGYESWQHHFVSATALGSPALDRLLRAVADDMTDGVLIVPDTFDWLYHPYDGGADVIAASVDDRDRLAADFARWRSPNASGL
jgi:hypothetical protein